MFCSDLIGVFFVCSFSSRNVNGSRCWQQTDKFTVKPRKKKGQVTSRSVMYAKIHCVFLHDRNQNVCGVSNCEMFDKSAAMSSILLLSPFVSLLFPPKSKYSTGLFGEMHLWHVCVCVFASLFDRRRHIQLTHPLNLVCFDLHCEYDYFASGFFLLFFNVFSFQNGNFRYH